MPFVTKKKSPWTSAVASRSCEDRVGEGSFRETPEKQKPCEPRSPHGGPSSGRCTWSNAVVTILRFLIISSLRWCLGREVWWEAQRERKGSVSSLQPGRRGLGSPQETMLRPGTHSDWRQGDGILENANRQEALLSSSLPG